MKIGFSSLASPAWDLSTVVQNAASLGFDGVELRGLAGELHLPAAPALARHPEGVRALFAENKIELVSLGASATLTSRTARELAEQKAVIHEYIELASRLGCGQVRIFCGETGRGDDRRSALARVASQLSSLVPSAVRHNVTLLVENGGDFPGSQDLWYLIDSVAHPAVRCCWNQCHAMTIGERPTISLPRLGNKIGMVHLSDATFDAAGVLLSYVPPGDGHAEVDRQIELLKGMVYRRYLIFEWPKLWVPSLPEPESVLANVAKFLRAKIAEKQAVLSAYKGDKNAPKLAAVPAPE